MLFTGRICTANEAHKFGLINEVCEEADLDSRVTATCNEILALSPQSIRLAKIGMHSASEQDFYGSFYPHAELLALVYGSDENMEGIAAFVKKRKPSFTCFRNGT